MPFTTPHTIALGELVTIATMNNEWGGNVSFLANPPACRVYSSVPISLVNAIETTLTFDSERYDTNSMHSTTVNPGRITFNTAGLYLVSMSFRTTPDNDYNFVYGLIRFNGSAALASHVIGTMTDNTIPTLMTVTTVYKFAVNDYVEARVAQKNTSAATNSATVAANDSPEFSATWIGLG